MSEPVGDTEDWLDDSPELIGNPDDKHRRDMSWWILTGIFVLFLIIVLGCVIALVSVSRSEDPNQNEYVLSTIQAVLTTSIGFLGGLGTAVTGYYYQSQSS